MQFKSLSSALVVIALLLAACGQVNAQSTNPEEYGLNPDKTTVMPAVKHGLLFKLEPGEAIGFSKVEVPGHDSNQLMIWDQATGKWLQGLTVRNGAWRHRNVGAEAQYIMVAAGCGKSGKWKTCQMGTIDKSEDKEGRPTWRLGFDEDYKGKFNNLLVNVIIHKKTDN